MALSALHACHDRGLRVPGDLAIAAVTDSLYLRTANPAVTALDLNGAEIGRRATELLVTLANGEEPASERVIVPSSLRVRASTGHADTEYLSE
ncbi:Periplasmic binding protein-like domain (plasmid) [Rubrobacter radiotolerans]|uniref:Periplasmic binding protein-like domain n=1 Tax=Rubrobacter radiotolerans TaxID=42256 RepID=A0A023X7U6_RUBRA|nr:Periplasmic binding protein-like domain [Rubrobacter radiotolerans]